VKGKGESKPSLLLSWCPPRHHTAKESGGGRLHAFPTLSPHTRLESQGKDDLGDEWLRRGAEMRSKKKRALTKRSGGREAAKACEVDAR
jgi:hypothetical protein